MKVEKAKHKTKKLEAEKAAKEIEIEKAVKEMDKIVIHLDKQNNSVEIHISDKLACKLKLDEDRRIENNFDCVHELVEYIHNKATKLYKYKTLKTKETEEYVFRVCKDIVEELKKQIKIYNEAKENIKQLFEKECKRVLRENKEATVSYMESWDIYTMYYTYKFVNVTAMFIYSGKLNKYKIELYENKKLVYESELHEVFIEALEEYTKELLNDLEGKLYNKAVETAEKIREKIKKELKEKYGIEAWDCEDWEEWTELAVETKVEYDGEVENEAIAVITFAYKYEHKCTMCEVTSITYYLTEDTIGVYIDEDLIKELTSN